MFLLGFVSGIASLFLVLSWKLELFPAYGVILGIFWERLKTSIHGEEAGEKAPKDCGCPVEGCELPNNECEVSNNECELPKA